MKNTIVVKSNISCGSCIAKVTPFLNQEEKIQHWSVDTLNKDKPLTVTGEDITQELIAEILKPSGYKVEATEFRL